MVVKISIGDEVRKKRIMEDFTKYLMNCGYDIGDFENKPVCVKEGVKCLLARIQDPTKMMTKPRWFSNERKIITVCEIGQAYFDKSDSEITIHVYGEEYFERMRKDSEKYCEQNKELNINIILKAQFPSNIRAGYKWGELADY